MFAPEISSESLGRMTEDVDMTREEEAALCDGQVSDDTDEVLDRAFDILLAIVGTDDDSPTPVVVE